jgi:hypothetical protein
MNVSATFTTGVLYEIKAHQGAIIRRTYLALT